MVVSATQAQPRGSWIPGYGVAVNDSKEIFLPFTTPVLGTDGSTWAREALKVATVIGASGTAASLISTDEIASCPLMRLFRWGCAVSQPILSLGFAYSIK